MSPVCSDLFQSANGFDDIWNLFPNHHYSRMVLPLGFILYTLITCRQIRSGGAHYQYINSITVSACPSLLTLRVIIMYIIFWLRDSLVSHCMPYSC